MAARTNQNNNPFTDEGVDEDELNATFDGLVPMNSPIPWDKTPSWSTRATGTADTNTANKLVDTGASFSTDGVTEGMVAYNSTDNTFGIIDAVDSETSLSLRADAQAGSAVTDVFPDGNEAYIIYNALELPDNIYELNGQVLSDAASIHNGKTLPDLNGAIQDSGTNTGIADTTLTDSSKSWTTNEWAGYVVEITSGAGVGQIRTIASNTATALTFSDTGDWQTSPSTSITYEIHTARKFIRGSYKSGGEGLGGAAWHKLISNEMPAHTHATNIAGSAGTSGNPACNSHHSNNVTTSSTGGDDIFDNRPPFYNLVWVMRIK